MDKVSEDNKKNVAVEMILQLGDKEDWQNVSLEDKKKMEQVFKKGLEVLESKGLKIGNAVIHLDEASPHLPYSSCSISEKVLKQVWKSK